MTTKLAGQMSLVIFKGQPTAYIKRRGEVVWVVPSQSVSFVES